MEFQDKDSPQLPAFPMGKNQKKHQGRSSHQQNAHRGTNQSGVVIPTSLKQQQYSNCQQSSYNSREIKRQQANQQVSQQSSLSDNVMTFNSFFRYKRPTNTNLLMRKSSLGQCHQSVNYSTPSRYYKNQQKTPENSMIVKDKGITEGRSALCFTSPIVTKHRTDPQSRILPGAIAENGSFKSTQHFSNILAYRHASSVQRQRVISRSSVKGSQNQWDSPNRKNLQSRHSPSKAPKRSYSLLKIQITNEEVDKWSKRYRLQWKQVYQLDSEFRSMIQIGKQNLEMSKEKECRAGTSFKSQRRGKDQTFFSQKIRETDAEAGVLLDTLIKYSGMFIGKARVVRKRILQAFGIDTSKKSSIVSWEQFLQLKSFLEYFSFKKEELIPIWLRVLDPHGLRAVSKSNTIQFLEILARGSTTEEQTLISNTYAREVTELLKNQGCFGESGQDLLIERVEDCFKIGIISIDVLNQAVKPDCLFFVGSNPLQ